MNDKVLYQTWQEYYPKVYGYYFRRLQNKADVEDLTSIVMTKYLDLISNEEKLKKVQNKHAYLWKIAHNQLANFIKLQQKQILEIGYSDDLFELDIKVETDFSPRYESKMKCLYKCIKDSLKDEDAQIVEMSFIQEKTSIEIAKALAMRPDNVRQRLSRSLKKIKMACLDIWHECTE
jgi:RNA polymerase sigma factor (sigma-70 family)